MPNSGSGRTMTDTLSEDPAPDCPDCGLNLFVGKMPSGSREQIWVCHFHEQRVSERGP